MEDIQLQIPLNITYIDSLIQMTMTGNYNQINESQKILMKFATNKRAIKYVNELLSKSNNIYTHLFALNIVYSTIKTNDFKYKEGK